MRSEALQLHSCAQPPHSYPQPPAAAPDFATDEPLRGAADLSAFGGAFDDGALEGATVTCFTGVPPVRLSGAVAACFEGAAAGFEGVAAGFGSVPVTRFSGVPAAR